MSQKPHQPSQKVWDQILENQPALARWKPWLNKHGLDGSLTDHTDSLSCKKLTRCLQYFWRKY